MILTEVTCFGKVFVTLFLRDQIKYSLKFFVLLCPPRVEFPVVCSWNLLFALILPDVCPKNASYYGNRAATLMMLSRYREALEDSQQAVRLDDTFTKVRGDRGDSNHLYVATKEMAKRSKTQHTHSVQC